MRASTWAFGQPRRLPRRALRPPGRLRARRSRSGARTRRAFVVSRMRSISRATAGSTRTRAGSRFLIVAACGISAVRGTGGRRTARGESAQEQRGSCRTRGTWIMGEKAVRGTERISNRRTADRRERVRTESALIHARWARLAAHARSRRCSFRHPGAHRAACAQRSDRVGARAGQGAGPSTSIPTSNLPPFNKSAVDGFLAVRSADFGPEAAPRGERTLPVIGESKARPGRERWPRRRASRSTPARSSGRRTRS